MLAPTNTHSASLRSQGYLRDKPVEGTPEAAASAEAAAASADPRTAAMARYNEMVMLSSQADSRIASITGGSNAYATSIAKSRIEDKKSNQQLLSLLGPQGEDGGVVLNEKALDVIKRVQDKLSGTDFGDLEPLGVPEQVRRLIAQATSNENLAVTFVGWCSFW